MRPIDAEAFRFERRQRGAEFASEGVGGSGGSGIGGESNALFQQVSPPVRAGLRSRITKRGNHVRAGR